MPGSADDADPLMMSSRLAKLRGSVSNSFRSWQSSTLVAIVVIPMFLDQVVAVGSPGVTAQQRDYTLRVLAVVAVLGCGIFAVASWRDYQRHLAQKRATFARGLARLPEEVHGRVTALVIQSQDLPSNKAGVSLAEFLLTQFPKARELVFVMSEEGNGEMESLQGKSKFWPRQVDVGKPIVIPAYRVLSDRERDDVLERLRQLESRHTEGMVLMDVTRGTKAMSLNMAEVARSLDIHVTYTPLHEDRYSGIYCMQPARGHDSPVKMAQQGSA